MRLWAGAVINPKRTQDAMCGDEGRVGRVQVRVGGSVAGPGLRPHPHPHRPTAPAPAIVLPGKAEGLEGGGGFYRHLTPDLVRFLL